jgi:hypothetical protein
MGTETVTCPICGEYEGEARSVESHISGKTDVLHKGEVGRQYREMLLGQEPSSEATSEAAEWDEPTKWGDKEAAKAAVEGVEEPTSESEQIEGTGEIEAEEIEEIEAEEVGVIEAEPPATVEMKEVTGSVGMLGKLGVLGFSGWVLYQLWNGSNEEPSQRGPAFPNSDEADLV